jgi:hypothetical protein
MTKTITCLHCQLPIPLSRHFSGVINRNHCPHCLWSVHADEKTGDRQSICHGQMEPVTLSFKPSKKNKYGPEKKGEILLVHLCQTCQQIRLNRIAADDDTNKIINITQNPITKKIQTLLEKNQITPIKTTDIPEIQKQLFGNNQLQ